MARLSAAAVPGLGVLAAGGAVGAVASAPGNGYLILAIISLFVVGVNITAWLVIPRMVASVTAPADAAAPGASAHTPPDGLADAPRIGPEWPGDLAAEPAADEWSSCWDYAGPDESDGDSAEDEPWYLPGAADNVSWSVAVGGPRSRQSSWSPGGAAD